jgi:uncharacterized RDD family membrane protein YckC
VGWVVRTTYAGFWLRAVASLIDAVIIVSVLGPVALLYPTAFFKVPLTTTISLASMTPTSQFTPLAIVILNLVQLLYFAMFESSAWQATPGKRILRLYVTDLNGRPLTFVRAAMRNCAKIISSLTFMVGYILAGFTKKKQALHDILAGCLVMRRK